MNQYPPHGIKPSDTEADVLTTLGGKAKWAAAPAPAASAVAVTPTGSIAATNTQAALAELDAEKSPVGHTHAASGITVQDENGPVASGVTQLDFQGLNVTAAAGTGEVVITVPARILLLAAGQTVAAYQAANGVTVPARTIIVREG